MHGLGNRIKRKSLFHYIRDKNLDVVLLQETHVLNKQRKQMEMEWGGSWYNSQGTSSSRGTAILFRRKGQFKINEHVL